MPMITETILAKDPSLFVGDPWEFELLDGTSAILFSSRDPSLGETRELWFIRDGLLYQVRMYAEGETWLDPLIREFASQLTFDDPLAL
jgi:hypothetical protein